MIDTQLYICENPLREEVIPVENSEESAFIKKPKRETGLWTSTWREETQDSDWVEWCVGNDFGNPDGCYWYLLIPQTDIRLYTIDSVADLHRLLRRYPWVTERQQRMNAMMGSSHFAQPDFESLAKEYDGLHLTERGNAVTHLSYPQDMNAWDCESVCWFRWKFAKVEMFRAPVKVQVNT